MAESFYHMRDLGNSSWEHPPQFSNVIANFIINITYPNAPLNVSFTDISMGTPNAWFWNFGDGTFSNEQNPTHTYLSSGNYSVTLKVNNENSTDTTVATINVLKNNVLPVADFIAKPAYNYSSLTVQFIDCSQNATIWYWDFGDGSNSTEQNPKHNYSTAGNYTVNLTVSNANGNASKNATNKCFSTNCRGTPHIRL